jgi:hypothetical protein
MLNCAIYSGCGIFVLSVLICSYLLPFYWVYIPAVIDSILYPAPIPNYEIQWSVPDSTNQFRPKKFDHPNIIVILADDLGLFENF